MAFQDKDRFKIIRLLGWPAKTLVESSTHYSNIVAARLENLPLVVEKEVKTLLVRIDDLDAKLDKQVGRAGIKKVQDIEFDGQGYGMATLRSERRRLLRELSELLDIRLIAGGGVNANVCI